tara:strand:- start:6 stop:842 length:837 start_codon:yes stop_codon:yes gene_type:complete
MAYIPESKINKLNTPGGEFIIKSTNQGYVGDYIELSNGKFYVGSDPKQLNEELIIPPSTNRLGNNRNARLYSNLKPQTTKFQTQVKSIYPSKSLPTDKDYTRGYYTRYFARKVNELRGYMEVDVDIFNSISQRKKTYDFNLYEVGSFTWNLKNGTTSSNFTNLQILERTFPFVSIIFPKLNEFEKIEGILTTPGGELYYEDGREYIGPYHVHEGAPMVGAEHTEEPHATLYYSKDLQNLNISSTPLNFNVKELTVNTQRLKNQSQNLKAPEVKGGSQY